MRRLVVPILLTIVVVLSVAATRPSTQTRPAAGTVISRTTRLPAGTYTLTSADLQHPAVIVRGSNLTVDFSGVMLRGAAPDANPDTFTGLAVLVDGGENVTIKNLTARGYTFGYSRFFVPIDWHLRYFTFDDASAPDRHAEAFARILSGPPVKTDRREALDYMSGGSIADGLPRDRVAVVAEGEVDLPPGHYTIRTISDEGVRVWMDDDRIIDHWTPHESAIDAVPVTGGRHRFKVEYYEIGGFAELRFEILRR